MQKKNGGDVDMKEKLLFCNMNNSNVKDKTIIQNQFALTFVALWSYPLVLGPYMQGGLETFWCVWKISYFQMI